MIGTHWVRFGRMGAIGRFAAPSSIDYPRGTEVVVRSTRGLECGKVIAPIPRGGGSGGVEGPILRAMSDQDAMLAARLSLNPPEAFRACRDHVESSGIAVPLIDIEQLFDGRTLVFYFLGELPPDAGCLVGELAALYESSAGIRRFAELVEHGCGPDCGTERGHGCGSCSSVCAIAAICRGGRGE